MFEEITRAYIAETIERDMKKKHGKRSMVIVINKDIEITETCVVGMIRWEYENVLVISKSDNEPVWYNARGYANHNGLFGIEYEKVDL